MLGDYDELDDDLFNVPPLSPWAMAFGVACLIAAVLIVLYMAVNH